MLGPIVRFDDEGLVPTRSDSTRQTPAPKDLRSSMTEFKTAMPLEAGINDRIPHELAWADAIIAQQTRMFECAQWEKVETLTELKRIGHTLCQEAWDAQARAGADPEGWPPKRIAEFIIQTLGLRLRNAQLAQDPSLVEQHRKSLEELAKLRTDNHQLRQRVRSAEDGIRELKLAAIKEADKQRIAAAKRSEATSTKQQTDSKLVEEEIQRHPVVEMSQHVESSKPIVMTATQGSGQARVDDVIRLIATEGLCRWKDIRAALARLWNVGPSAGTIDTVIKKTIGLELLRVEEVRLEWGGKPTGKMLILTEAGQESARSLGVEPVESQYARGLAAHKDAAHFYAILEVAAILANYFPEVDCFPPSISQEQGRYFADLSAVNSLGEKLYIEVERATYKAVEDREKKWLRAAVANNGTIYLATPNQESMQTILSEIASIRERHPTSIKGLRAFNVRSYRDGESQHVTSPWAFES